MAKKIRFPLEMENGVEVRSIEELKENFSLAKVMEYVKNGKLVIWLRDRYETTLADAVEKLDKNSSDIAELVCGIFEIPFDEKTTEELERAAERAEKIEKLRKYTEDDAYVKHIDSVSFDQDDLYDLLDEGENHIYLCGSKFSIPLDKHDMTYTGINCPVVVINSKVEVDFNSRNIVLENIVFDDVYQAILDSANDTKEKLYEKAIEQVKEKTRSKQQCSIGEYTGKTMLSFMINPILKDDVMKMYDIARNAISDINYDVDDDIREYRKIAESYSVIGLGTDFLESL